MVTLDKIRLTGLLRKTLANAGVFYMTFRRRLTAVPRRRLIAAVPQAKDVDRSTCRTTHPLLTSQSEDEANAPCRGSRLLLISPHEHLGKDLRGRLRPRHGGHREGDSAPLPPGADLEGRRPRPRAEDLPFEDESFDVAVSDGV